MQDYFKYRDNPIAADLGRYNVTKSPDDIQVFKVPSLRNVALTSPCFHDASAQTLAQAVAIMAKYQPGVTIPSAGAALIARFLNTLTGEYPAKPQ
jgi:cytochrome c peroxidase